MSAAFWLSHQPTELLWSSVHIHRLLPTLEASLFRFDTYALLTIVTAFGTLLVVESAVYMIGGTLRRALRTPHIAGTAQLPHTHDQGPDARLTPMPRPRFADAEMRETEQWKRYWLQHRSLHFRALIIQLTAQAPVARGSAASQLRTFSRQMWNLEQLVNQGVADAIATVLCELAAKALAHDSALKNTQCSATHVAPPASDSVDEHQSSSQRPRVNSEPRVPAADPHSESVAQSGPGQLAPIDLHVAGTVLQLLGNVCLSGRSASVNTRVTTVRRRKRLLRLGRRLWCRSNRGSMQDSAERWEDVANRTGLSVADLQRLNPEVDDDNLWAGKVLRLKVRGTYRTVWQRIGRTAE